MRHSKWLRLLRVLFGLLPLVALGRQFMVHRALGFNVVNFFSYFTILSNLFAGCVLLLSAVPVRAVVAQRSLELLRFIAVISMTLVGILFSALLRDVDLGSMLPWVNFVHHYLMPCVIVIDWIVLPPKVPLGRREFLVSLSFPLVYVVYALVRGAVTGWYPYPFLDAANVGGAAGVAAYVVGITVVFGIVGWALIALGNRRRWRSSF